MRELIAYLKPHKMPDSIVVVGDPLSTLPSIQEPSNKPDPFYSNKIFEIKSIVEEACRVV